MTSQKVRGFGEKISVGVIVCSVDIQVVEKDPMMTL